MTRPLLASRDARADEEKPLLAQLPLPPDRVGEVRVPAVHDDVARVEMGKQLRDRRVDGLAGLHHQHHDARPPKLRGELRERSRADDIRSGRRACQERVGLLGGAVVDGDAVAVVVHVEDEVLAHHREPDEADVRLRAHPAIGVA